MLGWGPMQRTTRKISLLALVFVLLGVVAGAGGMILFYRSYPPATVTASLPPAPTPAPPATPAPATASAPVTPAAQPTPAPAPAAPAPAAAPAAPELPPLPSEEVHEQPVNPVPSGVSPVPPVTIEDRNGHTVTRPGAPGRPAPAETPAPAPPPALPRQAALLAPPGATLAGPATATGTISLAVQGYGIRLYGIEPPAPGDRCTLGRAQVQSCAEVTQQVLAERLAHSASVTCRLPADAKPGELGRVCLDGNGSDIGGYLVGEGLAVADPRQARDYAGAESIAKT